MLNFPVSRRALKASPYVDVIGVKYLKPQGCRYRRLGLKESLYAMLAK
jgi:hypothetical protein